MNIDELLYTRFVENKKLCSLVSTYNGIPSIYNNDSPFDSLPGWGQESRYPLITYSTELQANEERNSVGTLTVFIYTSNDDEELQKNVQKELKNTLKDLLVTCEDNSMYGFSWSREDSFSVKNDGVLDLILGCQLQFDIYELVNYELTSPDPIIAIKRKIKEIYPNIYVIGLDRDRTIINADKENIVAYVSLNRIENDQITNTVTWMNGQFSIHIICSDFNTRSQVTIGLLDRLQFNLSIKLLDKSPMAINHLTYNAKADYIRNGQITIDCRYGVLRYRELPHSLLEARAKEVKLNES